MSMIKATFCVVFAFLFHIQTANREKNIKTKMDGQNGSESLVIQEYTMWE